MSKEVFKLQIEITKILARVLADEALRKATNGAKADSSEDRLPS